MTVDPLVSAQELIALLGSDLTVLDVRFHMAEPAGPEVYAAGHVPGAVYVDLDADLAAPAQLDEGSTGGRHPLPSIDGFQAAMRRLGVSDDRPVVVYDDWFGHAAGRAWWLLRYFGHADVRLLDGGLAAWRRADGPMDSGAATAEPGDFSASPGHLPLLDADGASHLANDGTLFDARITDRFHGRGETLDPVGGHIPGAVSRPTSSHLNPDGTFKSVAELRALYDGVENSAGAYCGSGVTATINLIALMRIGVTAALYPGSWSEWSRTDRPVAT